MKGKRQMKKINLDQGSQEWLSWRKTVITATDCPAILGSSPWSTAYKCWQRKLGLIEEQNTNHAMERGKRLEPEAREKFIKDYGINMTPVVVESSEYNFLGASLDGLSHCNRYILEVKCGGAKLHSMAAQGNIPPYYMDQMQHQLLVTGAEKAFYYSYDGTEGICIEVIPEVGFISRFIPKAREFWRCIAFSEAPELQSSDYKDMSDDPLWVDHSSQYKKLDEEIKELEKVREGHRRVLINMCDNESASGEGIRINRITMKGRVDYETIPQLTGIDLNQYRKPATTIWKVSVA